MTVRVRGPGSAWLAVATLSLSGCYAGWDGAKQSGSASDADPTAAADDGGSGEDTGEAPPLDACGGGIPEVAPHAMHRLTPLQYTNTIRDLFGDPEFEASYADLDPIPSLLGVRQLRTDAELVLARRDAWGTDVFGCDTSGAADDACAEAFIDTFGAKVFRRPLTDEERSSFRELYASATGEFTFADAMDVVLASMLGSPQFLYLAELGEPIEGAPQNVRRLGGYEIASRMSYLLWDTMPDDELLAAAEAGELVGREGLRAHAERLLADPRAEGMIQDFMWTWLQLDGGQLHHALEQTDKDEALFPEYGPALQEAMRTEIEALVHDVYFGQSDPTFEALLLSNRAYVNASLAALYGVPGPADDDTWAWVELDPTQRAGLLTRAGFLTVFATSTVQAPIRRGVLVIEEVLCNELGQPPPDVDNSPIEPADDPEGGTLTVRQAVEERTKTQQCQACHAIVNPAGFAFERYDAIGRWQDAELTSGLPIDSSGELITSDVDGPVADALEMSQKLAGSEKVRECFAGRWLFRATGTSVQDASDCDREQTLTTFAESGDVRELLVNIVLSDSFRFIDTGVQ
jgi:hypothetical protein